MTLTTPMNTLLAALASQADIASRCPGAYSPELWVGTAAVHKLTAQALIRRGLVDVGERCGFTTITINDRGLAALAA